MGLFVFIAFWVLLWFGRHELEAKWIWLLILAWLITLVGCTFLPSGAYVFVTVVAILDIGLILAIFGGDIAIR